MRQFLLLLVAVTCVIAAAPARAQDQTLLVRDPTTGGEVYISEVGDIIELRSIAPATVFIAYEIDVNLNNVVYSKVDLRFAFRSCSQYQYTATSFSGCGEFKTGGAFSEEVIGRQKVTKWRIPRRELSHGGVGFGITVEFYDSATKQIRRSDSGSWRFGGVAAAAKPSVKPPVAAPPATVRPVFETVIAQDTSNGVEVRASETADYVEFRSRGPSDIDINYHVFKVIGLNRHDLDRQYGKPWGRFCASIRISVNSWTRCDQTYGTFSTEMDGGVKITRWRIPKQSLSTDGVNFAVTVQLWDDRRKVARNANGTYRFGVGLIPEAGAGLSECPVDLTSARAYVTGVLVQETRNNPLMAEKTTVYSADRYVLGAKALSFYEVDNGFSVSLTFVLPGEPQTYAAAWKAAYGGRPQLDPTFCGKSTGCFHWRNSPDKIAKGVLHSATLYKNFTVNPTFTCTYSNLGPDSGW